MAKLRESEFCSTGRGDSAWRTLGRPRCCRPRRPYGSHGRGPNTFVVMMLTPSFSARLGISVADSFIRSRILALDIGHSSGECSAIITNCIYASPFRGAQAENAAPSIRPRGPGRGISQGEPDGFLIGT